MRWLWLVVVLSSACTCKKAEAPPALFAPIKVAPAPKPLPVLPMPPPEPPTPPTTPEAPPSSDACPSDRETHQLDGKPAFIWEQTFSMQKTSDGDQCEETGYSLRDLEGDELQSFSPLAKLEERFVIDVAGIGICNILSGEVVVYDVQRRALVLSEKVGDPTAAPDSLAGVLHGLGIERIGDSDSPHQSMKITPVDGAPQQFTVEVTAMAEPEPKVPSGVDVKVEHALIDLTCAASCKATLRSHEASTVPFIERVCD